MTNVPNDLIELGRIGEPYGLKGWVNVLPSSDKPEVLLKSKQWWVSRLKNPECPSDISDKTKSLIFEPFRILQSKLHSDRMIAHLEGLEQKELAAQFKGRRIYVSRSHFPATAENEHYWVDLINCTVSNPEGIVLGVVNEIVDHGAHPILVLKKDKEQPILIPFVATYILNVDIENKKILADWQEDYQ